MIALYIRDQCDKQYDYVRRSEQVLRRVESRIKFEKCCEESVPHVQSGQAMRESNKLAKRTNRREETLSQSLLNMSNLMVLDEPSAQKFQIY